MIKRSFDFLASLVGLILLSPLLIAIAIAIRLDSPGPVFYLGNRIGRYGHPFKMIKFRTMVVNADRLGGSTTSAHDQRMTKIGSFLRKYKLDELSQLINVLRGEMSFVGPRPHVAEDVALLRTDEQDVLSLRPGITDYSSIKYSNEGEIVAAYPDADEAYRELIRPGKVWLQQKYLREQSLITDLKIIGMTLGAVLGLGKPEIPVPHELELDTRARHLRAKLANA